MTKSDMIGLRIPSDLLMKIDKLKDEEGIDRTALILRALRYWIGVNGKISTDAEYLNSIKKIESGVGNLLNDMNEIKTLREQVAEQQKVISALVKMLPNEK
ncbi:MAG: ribbon-helix-helix domain-containing protein [Methanocorpusculum sp.]|nr:ribbon-helix-helix domain-containing protein [Methanocorpusculum sp.]